MLFCVFAVITLLVNNAVAEGSGNAKSTEECGTITPNGAELVLRGMRSREGEVPWHAGIYVKTFVPYMQVCGGSLISKTIIISAAVCFWSEEKKQLPAVQYAVAVGKLYRPWNNAKDKGAQKSDVAQIHIPERFAGAARNFQDDIALVVVVDAFDYSVYVRPVCLSFDADFEQQQLQPGNKGKVAGWGLTAANGKPSPVLRVKELSYVDSATCIDTSPRKFHEYITNDKFCAVATETSSALYKGDAGGGFAMPTTEKTGQRYYLRGVVSTAPKSDDLCNLTANTGLTDLAKHEHFIRRFWTEL